MFLEQYWGGPTTYSRAARAPAAAHAARAVPGEPARRGTAGSPTCAQPSSRCDLAPMLEAVLWDYLERAAWSMVNTME